MDDNNLFDSIDIATFEWPLPDTVEYERLSFLDKVGVARLWQKINDKFLRPVSGGEDGQVLTKVVGGYNWKDIPQQTFEIPSPWDDYNKLEYIQSQGDSTTGSYLAIPGFDVNPFLTNVEIDLALVDAGSQTYNSIFGSRSSANSSDRFDLEYNSDQHKWNFRVGNVTSSISDTSPNTKKRVMISNVAMRIDSGTCVTFTKAFPVSSIPIYFGAINQNNSPLAISHMKVYSLSFMINGTMHTLTPARRKEDQKVGLFDGISSFYSSASTEYLAGPEIV